MTPTQLLTDGPLGLEATHRFTAADAAAILMHHRAGSLPRVWFDTMPNFRALPDFADRREPRTGRDGENVLPSRALGKTFTVTGRLIGESPQQVRQLDQACKRVFGERDREGVWAVEPLEALGGITDHQWVTICRVLAYEPDGENWVHNEFDPLGPWQLGFTLTIRQADARWLWNDSQDTTALATPFDVENEGIAPADPTLVVEHDDSHSAGQSVTVINTTIGRQIAIRLLNNWHLADGAFYINFADRTVFHLADGATYPDDVEDATFAIAWPSTTWWDPGVAGIAPGENTINSDNATTVRAIFNHSTW